VEDLIGWEGVWGMLFSGIILTFTTFFPCNRILIAEDNLILKDNMIFASHQVYNNPTILVSLIVTILVMGPFNYFGACIPNK
jgi:hypothetical protein